MFASVFKPARLLAVLAFGIATVALSNVLGLSRELFENGASMSLMLALIGWAGLLALAFGGLLFRSYLASRQEGKVVHTIWLFEKLSQWISSKERHAR